MVFYFCCRVVTLNLTRQKGTLMIINWVATKTQRFLPIQNAEPDELSVNFDFALSAEIMDLLYAQNDGCLDAGRATQRAVAEDSQQIKEADAIAIIRCALDEHELALA